MPSAVWRPEAVVLCGLCLVAASSQVNAQAAGAGRIKAVVGTCSIVRGGQSAAAAVGALVHEEDVVRTGSDGQLAIMLKDESRLSLGPNSELSLRTFTYDPSQGRLALVLRMAHGALSYVSGRIAKLMPDAVRLETPTSVIGVRGTHALVKVDAP
jgi:hypothetical protein